MIKRFRNILAKSITSPTRRNTPPTSFIRIGPNIKKIVTITNLNIIKFNYHTLGLHEALLGYDLMIECGPTYQLREKARHEDRKSNY